MNVDNTTNKGEKDSKNTRKKAGDGHIVKKKEELTIVSEDELTPAEKEELAAKEEAQARNVPIRTPWFTNSELPTIDSVGGLGLEDITFFSEQEEHSKAYKIDTEISSYTKDREALVLSAHSAAYRIGETITGNDEMLGIIRDIEKYKQDGLLLMWLQVFHLHCINHDFRDWKDFKHKNRKNFNGNIFKWAKYEDTLLDDKESTTTHSYGGVSTTNPGQAGFKTILGWDGTSDYGTPGGIQFFELSTTEPTHYDKRGEGNTGIYNYSQLDSDEVLYGTKQLDNSLFYNDPEWHPWGPQWTNERGFYYIAGQPGDAEPPYSSDI